MPSGRALPAALAGVLAAACGVLSPEEQLLAQFFRAARLHDTTALSRLASTDFNPRTRGIVRDFDVLGVERGPQGPGGTRTVRVSARVHRPDGQISVQALEIAITKSGDRWIVASVR